MNDWISAERLSHLVGLIYDAAIDLARWPLAMEAIRTELNFHNATLDLILLPSGQVISNVVTSVPEDYLPILRHPDAGAAVLEQWGGAEAARRIRLDQPAVLTKVNPAFDFETTVNPYYLAFAKPQGIVDVLAIGLARDERAIGSIAFGRHISAGPIGAREEAIAELLVPHLQRAATINRMLDSAELARASFATAIDTLAVPVILVGPDLQIVHANLAATALLDRADLVRRPNGRLSVVSPGANHALSTAVRHAVDDESRIARRGLGIPLRHRDGPAGALHVLPLSRKRAGDTQAAVAAVFVAQVDSPFVPQTEIAAALFDLSRAEARVFGQIATGVSVSKTADALGVSRATVRTHLSRLYEKTGVHRQADLVRIAASLSVPVHEHA